MSDFDSVCETARTILEFEPSHVINLTGYRAATAETCGVGLEKHMVVNAISPYLLFSIIASKANVVHFVNYTSRSIRRIHDGFSKSWLFDFDNKQFSMPYARSKYVLEVSTAILSRRYPEHKFTLIDPGMVKSRMTKSEAFPLFFRLLANFFPTANFKFRTLSRVTFDWKSNNDSNIARFKLFGTRPLESRYSFDEAEIKKVALCIDNLNQKMMP